MTFCIYCTLSWMKGTTVVTVQPTVTIYHCYFYYYYYYNCCFLIEQTCEHLHLYFKSEQQHLQQSEPCTILHWSVKLNGLTCFAVFMEPFTLSKQHVFSCFCSIYAVWEASLYTVQGGSEYLLIWRIVEHTGSRHFPYSEVVATEQCYQFNHNTLENEHPASLLIFLNETVVWTWNAKGKCQTMKQFRFTGVIVS